jgi:flagellar protein FlaG
MNEVRPTNSGSAAVSGSSSTQAGSGKVGSSAERVAGNSLPPVEAPAAEVVDTQESLETQQAKLDEAVSRLNDYVQSTQRDLYFSYNENVDKTIVTVVDRNTEEVIRQIPNEVAVQLAQQINEDEPVRLFSAQA